ncbi:hypothetical protein E4U43_000425 [Claviceps pusilla]|uniref:GDP/GTP exchange factor Sec2 N-terminal domain-containing protein n=1 Tax=Claviceps pusilla TaxID=123648 RepID=A0A9P7N9F6_9HYPO|nr:hypothetical protein E4U43_000425 [Claviceps pusilla]
MAAPTTTTSLHCCPTCGSVNTLSSIITTAADKDNNNKKKSNNNDSSDSQAHSSPELLLSQAQSRITQLEAQVTELNAAAAAAASRWADYEAELHALRSVAQGRPSTPLQQQYDLAAAAAVATLSTPTQQQSPPSSILQQGTSRLSSLLYPRKSTPNLRQNSLSLPNSQLPSSPGAASTEDLMEALTREQTLRREAEGRLSATSKEVEELSVSLFEQANQMVADERRARARLEERVGELELRDKEKKKRLERLEGAIGRIEKARNLLER